MRTCPTCHNNYSDDTEFCPRDGARLIAKATETEAQLAAGLSRRFRIIRRLGAGGMGTVFIAEQIAVGNRPVALKVLNRKLLDDPDFLLRFQNEAGSTGRIRHPNVVTIHESGQGDDGTPYIAMEYLEGETLRHALKTRGALPVAECAEILQQAAHGLNAAHKLSIIHRDLKPDNIFLTRGDEGELILKVVDFGIAKLRESATHTLTGMVLGTPAYMSYEQASGMRSDELDARSDVYSLGVVVYEMLSGRVPFHSDTPLGYLRKHMMEEPPPFRAVAPGLPVPPQVEAVVMKALKKEREERYPSALEFARAFVAAAQPTPAAEVSQPLPSTKIVRPPAAREPAAPMPLSASAPARADTAVQTPRPAPPKRIAEAPSAQPQGSKPVVAASRPPAAPEFARRKTGPDLKKSRLTVRVAVLTCILMLAAGYVLTSRIASKLTPTTPAGPSPAKIDELGPTAQQHTDELGPTAQQHFDRGYALIQKHDWRGAIAEYRKGITLEPNDADAHVNLGVALENKGDWDGATAEYREALRLNPKNEYAHVGLGNALYNKGDWDRAIAEYREALRLNPKDAEAHNFLGDALEQKGDQRGGLEEYRAAYTLDPKNPTYKDKMLLWQVNK